MGNILILAKDKLLLENLLKILSENTFYCDGFLLKEKDLMKKIVFKHFCFRDLRFKFRDKKNYKKNKG